MKTRYFTISCLYPSQYGESCVPMICLCGKWLELAGFVIGDEVSVEVTRKGEIVIRTLPGERQEERVLDLVTEEKEGSNNKNSVEKSEMVYLG